MGRELRIQGNSVAAALMYTPMDRKQMVSASGIARWEYRGKYLDGVSSDKVAEVLGRFTSLQLNTFHAL